MEQHPGLDLAHSFLIAAEELSFRRTAERLGIDHSALSRRIAKLERQLGFQLFERTTREVVLTPAGRSFYESGAPLLAAYDQAVATARRVAQGKTGLLRVAYMAFAAIELMPRAVKRFRAANPAVEIGLRYLPTEEQKRALAEGEIDLGFMIGPFEHSDFESRQLASDPLHVFMPRGHPLSARHTVEPHDLAGEDLLLGDMADWEAYRRHLGKKLAYAGVPVAPHQEASSTMALLGLVAAGFGVTVYPRQLIGLTGTTIVSRPIADPAFHIETVLVRRRIDRTAGVRRFMECAMETVRPAPAEHNNRRGH
ncbi:LysR family transcriptional regulator [Aquibium sp. A9E412]|uniref:LysR family transcriptional regulator n=1 Tax=Aquibium sp. A9E412 TaxID=2976767 RepID=UPI0025B104CE|nr:LysR family transcriptional regulator [Aquibium sp. A9E412]MDN2565749.1 LysR family transcriptional regulator [Aquibium sp. A9E412]